MLRNVKKLIKVQELVGEARFQNPGYCLNPKPMLLSLFQAAPPPSSIDSGTETTGKVFFISSREESKDRQTPQVK